MISCIRMLKAFSSEIKFHRWFYLSTRSCYGISVSYGLLWFCFIKVTARVSFKCIHLERFRLSADEDLGNFFVTDKSDNLTGRWHRQGYWLVSYLEKKSSLHVPVYAFSYTAGGRAPAFSFVVSLRTVLCLIGPYCSAYSFMVIPASFGIQWGHKLSGTGGKWANGQMRSYCLFKDVLSTRLWSVRYALLFVLVIQYKIDQVTN